MGGKGEIIASNFECRTAKQAIGWPCTKYSITILIKAFGILSHSLPLWIILKGYSLV